MNLIQKKSVNSLKKLLFKSLNEAEIRSFRTIYSTMHNPNMKDRLHKVQMDYHTLLLPRSESEKQLIKRIFKEARFFKTYNDDVLTLKKQQTL